MMENKDEDEHIITGINHNELNDFYDIAIDENTIFDEQLRRMFDRDDDIIV